MVVFCCFPVGSAVGHALFLDADAVAKLSGVSPSAGAWSVLGWGESVSNFNLSNPRDSEAIKGPQNRLKIVKANDGFVLWHSWCIIISLIIRNLIRS